MSTTDTPEVEVEVETPTVTDEEALAELLKLARNLNTVQQERFKAMLENEAVAPILLAKSVGIAPQVVYSYLRSGRLASHLSETGKKVIHLTDAVEFVKNRMVKEAAKQAKIEAELAGEG